MDDPGIVGSNSLRTDSLYSTTISTCGNKCTYRIFSVAGCFYVEKLFTDTHLSTVYKFIHDKYTVYLHT